MGKFDAAMLIAQTLKKCVLVLVFDPGKLWSQTRKDAPYLDRYRDMQLHFDGGGLVICETEKEAHEFLNNTYGDNDLDGSVYCMLINEQGECCGDNT